LLTEMKTTLFNNYALSNVTVKFCKIFTGLTCKKQQQQNKGDFLLTKLQRISSSVIETDVIFNMMTFIWHIGTNITKELLPPSSG